MKKFIRIFLILIFIVCLNTVIVNASDFSMSLKAESEELKKGDEFDLSMYLDDNIACVNILQGKIEFDSDVLELMKSTSDEEIAQTKSEQGWNILLSTEGNFILTGEDYTYTGKIGSVRFKLKENVDSTKISITEIEAIDENIESYKIDDVSMDLNVSGENKSLKNDDSLANNDSLTNNDSTNYIFILVIAVIVVLLIVVIVLVLKKSSNKKR